MPQEDYLKKRIDQLGKALGKLLENFLGLKSKGQFHEGIQQLTQDLKTMLDIDLEEWQSMDSELFNRTLNDRNFNDLHRNLLAEILFQYSGGFDPDKDKEMLRPIYKNILSIYEDLNKRDTTYSMERHFRIGKMSDLLSKA